MESIQPREIKAKVHALSHQVMILMLLLEAAESGHRPLSRDDVLERCSQARRFITEIELQAGMAV